MAKGRPKTVKTFKRLPDQNGVTRFVDINPASIKKLFDVASAAKYPQTAIELAFATGLSKYTVNAILECTNEGKKLIRANMIALKRGPGTAPAWVNNHPSPIDIPHEGVTTGGELVLWEKDQLPSRITDKNIVKDFSTTIGIMDKVLAATNRVPKTVLGWREALVSIEVHSATVRQDALRVNAEQAELVGEMRSHNAALKDSHSLRMEKLQAELDEAEARVKLAEAKLAAKAAEAAVAQAGV